MTYAAQDDSNAWLAGHPAALRRAYGKGTITYVGATLDPKLMQSFVVNVLQSASVHPNLAGLPSGVELMQRSSLDHRVWIIIDHNTIAEQVDTHQPGTDLLTDKQETTLLLRSHGVAVIALTRSE